MKAFLGILVLGLVLTACGSEEAVAPNGRSKTLPSDFGGTQTRSVQEAAPCPPRMDEAQARSSTMRDRLIQARCYGQ